MARTPTQFSIAGARYTTTVMPATESLEMIPRLIRVLGKELLTLWLMSDEETLEKLLKDPEVMANTIFTISTNAAAEPGGLAFLREGLKYTTVEEDGGDVSVYADFDDRFAGELSNMLMVVVYALRASFTKL